MIFIFIFVTFSFPFEMVYPQSILMESLMFFSLSCNVFASCSILVVGMVDDTRRYEPLSVENNCRTVKGSDHPNVDVLVVVGGINLHV
jgi:hypothetical protein